MNRLIFKDKSFAIDHSNNTIKINNSIVVLVNSEDGMEGDLILEYHNKFYRSDSWTISKSISNYVEVNITNLVEDTRDIRLDILLD